VPPDRAKSKQKMGIALKAATMRSKRFLPLNVILY